MNNRLFNSILFMGSPEFSLPSFETLYNMFPKQINGVFTQPDTPQGRGKKVESTPVKKKAMTYALSVYEPRNKIELEQIVFQLNPTFIVVIAYGIILSKPVTDAFFCLNIHASLLPKYRGASPIQSAILAGEKETGVTLIRMNEKMDEGDMILKKILTLSEKDSFGDIHDQLATLSATGFKEFVTNPLLQTKIPTPQPHHEATYCGKIQKEDYILRPKENPLHLFRKIKAFSPVPGAYVIQDGARVKILDAEWDGRNLHILEVQPEGKKRMFYREYCLGNPKGIGLC